jgi:hypothetical protein
LIRQLRELLEKDQVGPEVLDAAGVASKEELDQFVTALELARSPEVEPGPGREIVVSLRHAEAFDPPPSRIEVGSNTAASLGPTRTRGHVVDDEIRGNGEGVRFLVPPELRAGFAAYRAAISRATAQSR